MALGRRTVCAGLSLLATSLVGLAQRKTEPSSPPATLESIIERVRPSIIGIKVTFDYRVQERPETLSGSGSGSGFIIDSVGHIATAGHVVSLTKLREALRQNLTSAGQHLIDDAFRITSVQIVVPMPSVEQSGILFYANNYLLKGTVLAEDDAIDVAVLASDPNPLTLPSNDLQIHGKIFQSKAQVATLQTTPPHDGDMISVSGFPLNIPVLVTNTGWIASALFIDERKRSLYLGDISVNHGNSGGPAYSDVDGRVIGCVTEYRPAPEGNSRLTVIVPIQRILDLLATVKAN